MYYRFQVLVYKQTFFEECIIVFQTPAQFQKIKMSRILLSFHLNFGCSSYHSCYTYKSMYIYIYDIPISYMVWIQIFLYGQLGMISMVSTRKHGTRWNKNARVSCCKGATTCERRDRNIPKWTLNYWPSNNMVHSNGLIQNVITKQYATMVNSNPNECFSVSRIPHVPLKFPGSWWFPNVSRWIWHIPRSDGNASKSLYPSILWCTVSW
jgi:hypothetical protein